MIKKNQAKTARFNFWPYFKSQKLLISIWLSLMIIDIGVQTFIGIFSGYILANISTGLYILAIKQFAIMCIVLICTNIMQFFRGIIYCRVSNKITNDMRIDIANQAFKIADKSYTDHKTSNFTQRISSDPSTIFEKIASFVSYIQQIVTCVIMITYIIIISPMIGLLATLAIVCIFGMEKLRQKHFKKNKKELLKRNEKTSGLLNEIIRSEKDIKSLNLENKLSSNLKTLADSQAEQSVKLNTVNSSLNTLRKFVINILMYSILILGLWQTHLGALTLASFMIIYSNRFEINYLANILTDFTTFTTEISLAVSRINELYEDDEYEIEKFGTKTIKNVKGKIEFKNVAFSYTEYKERSEEEIKAEIKENKNKKIKAKVKTRIESGKNKVFENLNFEIEPSTTVAFVGISGRGKSTILNLISKMYNVDSGKVLIDGVDIQKLNKQTIRDSITLVNQFPYIFDMSIKDNLLLAKPNATDEEIIEALKSSALLEFVNTLPDGINTIVGESGIKLSGGQKQRLAIARALLKKFSIILFDESTSSLDNLSQNKVKESIDNIKGKSTVVIVAHRLSTIKNADKIFFLENGEIVDSGTFEELYKRNKSFKTIFLAENL
ncbi:ABC transporter ATP-binding protein [bacterium]|nr:ABC transporter ATP-binding protein [bacterium]